VSASEPPEPPEPPVVYRRPAWVEPPVDLVPGIMPVELVLARTPERAIGLTGIRAYPAGFGCTLHLRLRADIPGEQSNFGAFNMFGDGVDPAGEFADYYLRFGVGFADGRSADNDPRRWPRPTGDQLPDPPLLYQSTIGPDGGHVWLWGLPPPGPLTFACDWPAQQIPPSQAVLEAGLVLAAAARAQTLWPDQDPP
jgi:hypothetical protein